ncbi:MAG: hypothetical protein IIZ61_00400, partial [Lachnospiraceae bacterium]|nr:hypothetical protein [Lachnospiraceae bacterium]
DYDKQEKASQQASLYEDRVHDTNELLIAFMEEKYPFQSTVTQILTDILKYDPLRFLLDSENQSANETIFTLMVCLNKDRILKALPDFDIDALIKAEYKKSKKDGDDDDITLDDMLRNAFVDVTITDYVTPRLRDFERFDARNKDALKALDNPPKDLLLRMQPDLMELYITGAMFTRLATVKSGSTFGGSDKLNPTLAQKIGRTLSVRDTLSSDEFLVPKQQIFEGLFMQSRAAAILSVDAHDAWNAMNEFLTEDERKMLEADKTLETDVERIYAFAEDLMVRGKQLQAAAKQRLIDEIKASDERKSKQHASMF